MKTFLMKILVTFALENEFAPWQALRKFRREVWGAANVYRTEVGAADVGVALTGAGPKPARTAATQVLSHQDDINFCISSGLAGALRPELRHAQIVAARATFAEPAHVEEITDLIEASEPLLTFAEESGATVVDRFYSAGRVIARSEEKRLWGKAASAVEMESFDILSVAAESGIPAIAIRSISDTVGEDLPLDMNRVFSDEGQVSLPRVIGEVVRHPGSVTRLVRLGQSSKAAAESLAKFLDGYVALIAARYKALEARARATGGA
jgi:adenosylhomocysteine nucleosidase